MDIYTGKLTEDVLRDPNNTHVKIVHFIGDKKDILEVGCASGYLTKYLTNRLKSRVTCVEINPEAARMATPYCERMIVGDVEDERTLAQLAAEYEVIILADVLEHLRRPEETLLHLKGRLHRDGYLIISTPNIAHWTIRRALLFGRFDYTSRGVLDKTHLHFYTPYSIRALLANCGYAIRGWGVTYIFPWHWRHNLGARLGKLLAPRKMPGWFENLFGYQFVIQARVQ